MTEQRETRLLAEYLAERWAGTPLRMNVPLGPVAETLTAALGARAIGWARPFRPEVDAVILPGGKMLLVEAKILSVIDGIAKLPVYGGLVDSTPELLPFRGLPRELIVVCPWSSEHVLAMARTVGVEVAVFRPAWIEGYLEQRMLYWTADYRRNREQKRALRKQLGVD